MLYPSVRDLNGLCMAVLRPPALTIPIQGCHLRYIWDGEKISDIYKESKITNI
ncbi:RES family NAD+ phosphorylase [Legionella pneumophila]|uniref:RES family NAD+ phosphorylase n=1 Tax=Legionella pneumophila TaxID=446 RepID=UPI002E1DE8F2